MSNPIHTNRLIHEKSPYLLQHAHNPIDWYPWSEEAFSAAKNQDKPIFLSIGYASCHWCHVMEVESFSKPELAELMNTTFINIKVDREERPEVDSLYMEFAQAMMSGTAGWPLHVILTPELMPFFATTYLPPDVQRHESLSLKHLTQRIKQIWSNTEERERVIIQAGKIVDVFATPIEEESDEDFPSKEKIGDAAEVLFRLADPLYGGLKGAPKFPIGFQGVFLLHYVKATGESRALFYVERTLSMMFRGGIYDHLGSGFARYSVDESWLIPHFEKMLYDNAILAQLYLEAWQCTKQKFYREVGEQILSYVTRELTDERGGFYSAEDADSEGEEGKFYTWEWEEIEQLLKGQSALFCSYYGISRSGNFDGRNILNIPHDLQEYAAQRALDPIAVKKQLESAREKLFLAREERIHPLKDDQIITAWNGLMIYTFAEAGKILCSQHYLTAAQRAAQFVKNGLIKNGVLYRRWREGEARHTACLDDYVFLIRAFLSLFEADVGIEWLKLAIDLSLIVEREFKSEEGGFYFTNGKDPSLLLRRCEFYDAAEPSGNAVHAENSLRLFQITGEERYFQSAEDILEAARSFIEMYPPGACYHLMALQRYYDEKSPTLVISLNEEESYKQEIGQMLAAFYIPHKAVIWRRENEELLFNLSPLCRDKVPLQGKTTLYICNRYTCAAPIFELPKMWEAMAKL